MKLRCQRCGTVLYMSPVMFDMIVDQLGLTKDEYLTLYQCKLCRRTQVFNWTTISQIEDLPNEFVNKYKDKLVWYYVSLYHKLTPEFVLGYIEKLCDTIFDNPDFESLPDTIKLLLKAKFGK